MSKEKLLYLFDNGTVLLNIIDILHNSMYIYLTSQNLKFGTALWNPGVLPPSLIAFDGQVHPIDSSMLVTDLGYRYKSEEISKERLEAAAVIHFSGPAKPWLEIGFPEYRSLWSRYVNVSNKFIRRCRILG
jgi:alpha-1,4-galacturonosyltransferase